MPGTLRIAARMLARMPGLTLSAMALLAIAMGGGTLLFSAFEAVWLRPLPVRHPEQLVRMAQHTPQLGARSYFPYPYYRALRQHSTTLSSAFGELALTVAMNQPAPPESRPRPGQASPHLPGGNARAACGGSSTTAAPGAPARPLRPWTRPRPVSRPPAAAPFS